MSRRRLAPHITRLGQPRGSVARRHTRPGGHARFDPALRPRPRTGRDRLDASAQALRNSLDLAQHVERLGYLRHWVAEHHNMPGIASSAPAVLIAHLASVTSTIRVGSGGVMLPNHQPLVIAEQFGMLEALHPGRIDLGIGRAPGHRPGHRCTHCDARSTQRQTTCRRSSRSCSRSSRAPSRGSPPCPARDRCRRSGCSARATSARGSRASSGCRSRSRTTSCRRTRSRRWRSTGAHFTPSPALARAVRDGRRRRRLRGDATSRRGGCTGSAQPLVPAAPYRPPVHVPLTRGGGGVRVLARRAGVRRRAGQRRTSSARRRPSAPACSSSSSARRRTS